MYLPESLKCKRLKTLSIEKDGKQVELSYIAGGSVTLENY